MFFLRFNVKDAHLIVVVVCLGLVFPLFSVPESGLSLMRRQVDENKTDECPKNVVLMFSGA